MTELRLYLIIVQQNANEAQFIKTSVKNTYIAGNAFNIKWTLSINFIIQLYILDNKCDHYYFNLLRKIDTNIRYMWTQSKS